MRKLLIVVALGLPSLARAATWNLDPAHTSVQFSVRHLMVSTVRGAFAKVTGTVQVDEKDLTRSKIQATIDVEEIRALQMRIALLDAGVDAGLDLGAREVLLVHLDGAGHLGERAAYGAHHEVAHRELHARVRGVEVPGGGPGE